MIRSSLLLALFMSNFCAFASADELQLDEGAVGAYLRLKELQTRGSVLHVVAHPDDEDGAMLAYCARGLGARTMLFSITRGEGGANMISSHFFDELGALRTLEHTKAASYYGIKVFYSRAADYGYSKTLEEAMRQWKNGIPILEDLVEVIRREQPTVLVSRFAGDPRDGHGHHQMAGVLSRKAFEAAADPAQFPKQLERGLKPWQVKKLYVRAGSPWRKPKEGEWTIKLPTGQHDPVIGKSYAQIARFGLGFQRSQGITGHDSDPGPQFSYYRLAKLADSDELPKSEESFFDGLDTSWSGLLGDKSKHPEETVEAFAEVDMLLNETLEDWDPRHPDWTVRSLLTILQRTKRFSRFELSREVHDGLMHFWRKLYAATIDIADVRLETWVTDQDGNEINFGTPGDEVELHIRLANQGPLDIEPIMFPQSIRLASDESERRRYARKQIDAPKKKLPANEVLEFTEKIVIPKDAAITRAHWSREDIAEPMYDVRPNTFQLAMPLRAMSVSGKVRINSVVLDVFSRVEVRRRDPTFGNVRYPFLIVPDKSVRFALSKRIVPQGQTEFETQVTVRNAQKVRNNATVELEIPDGWNAQPAKHQIEFAREDEESTVSFVVSVPQNATTDAYDVRAVVRTDRGEFREGFETVTARDLDRLNIYHDAVQQVRLVDVQVAGTPKVGYISGSGDTVAESLASLGIAPTMLSESDLASSDLSKFDVILVGVRAYAVRDDIRTHNGRLLEFVKQGGTLIIQYQTPEFDENFGPYPYTMSRPEEVSEEDAKVTVLEPTHPIFTSPNKITVADFDGWFEQRGSKFWRTWDEKYTPLLECHDTGQPKQEGGMLITKYGKGVYVYSAYAWYRQLPQGVPGAYRLFANMLSLPESGLVE